MSVSSRVITLAAAGSGGAAGGGTVTLVQSTDVNLRNFDYDTTYGAETMIVDGLAGPYWNGSLGYYSIFLCKVLTSDGSVSSVYYDDQGATGAWFPQANLGLVSGSYLYNFGAIASYRLGFSRWQFTSNWGSGAGYGGSSSTAFTWGGCVGKSTNAVYHCGMDLFSGSDYRGTVSSSSISGNSLNWCRYNTYTTNISDRASSIINDNSDNLYISMNWSDGSAANKIPGLWKLNSSGTTQFSYKLNQSSSIVDYGGTTQSGKAIQIDSSNNIYIGMHCRAAAALSTNNRYLGYFYSVTTGGSINWAKSLSRDDIDTNISVVSVDLASDGNLWVAGNVSDYSQSPTEAYGFWAKLNSSTGALMSFTIAKNATGVSGAYISFQQVKELPSGKLGIVARWNGGASVEAQVYVIEPNTIGDFGDYVFEDWTSLVVETTDSSASFSNQGSQGSHSYSLSNHHNPQSTSVTTSVTTL